MSTITLWQDSEKRIINPQLFSDVAEKFAREIGGEGNRINKGTQLRRFFDEIVRLQSLAKSFPENDSEKWANLLPYIHMLVAKAAYAQGRKLVSPSFVALLKSGISQIETRRDLTIFANFFESFMGFYKLHGPS